MRKAVVVLGTAILVVLSSPNFAQQKSAVKGVRGGATRTPRTRGLNCDDPGVYCTDLATHKNYEGKYSGHDEPAVAFYSDTPGSGNSMIVHLTLPTDPPTLPKQDGTGGTFTFQLQPAFWFGMALCDTQSAPAPDFNPFCTPDTDFNIFENTDNTAPDFVTIHPGTAAMELQFFPPGWVGTTVVDPTHWFAALTIDSLNYSWASFMHNNADCLNKVGEEPFSFALITRNNVPVAPPDPLSIALDPTFAAFTPNSQTLAMNPGDYLTIIMHDFPSGFRVFIFDQTTHQFGWMTASVANGFQQVVFAPDPDPAHPSVTCSQQPYAFHPMYSTSSENTRVVWAAHAFNVGFGGELGHFEYCNAIDANGNCTSAGVSEPDGMLDGDDTGFFGFGPCGSTVPPPANPFVPLIGCVGTDIDFDGVAYGSNWPGSLADPVMDHLLHATPLRFTGPKFSGPTKEGNYSRVAFESNVPGLEFACDTFTGGGCVNPPPGANFYPFYSTGVLNGQCVWQLGDANFPGTTNVFGGTAAAEFGPLVATNLPFGNEALPLFEVYRQVIPNPCLGR